MAIPSTIAPVIFRLRESAFAAATVGGPGLCVGRREACSILTADRKDLDLRNQSDTRAWLSDNRPMRCLSPQHWWRNCCQRRAAANFFTTIWPLLNIIHGSAEIGVKKLMFWAACLYPRLAPQPMSEDSRCKGRRSTNE